MNARKSGSPKKRTKGPRIALHLPMRADGLSTRCEASWSAIKADTVHFPTPYPPASEVEGDLAALRAALSAAVGGDPVANTALAVAEEKVRVTWEQLGKYVQSVVRAGPIEDAAAIISSVLMFESKVGTRGPKAELEARNGATSGVALLLARAVATAVTYFWEYSLDQVTWTAGNPTAQTRNSLVGLTPGKVYAFRFRALLRDGSMTDASQVVSLMVK